MDEKLKITCVISNLGMHFTATGSYYIKDNLSTKYKFDEKFAEKTFNRDWYFLPNKTSIEGVKILKDGIWINKRYELIEPSMESNKIPSVLTLEDVKLDNDHCWTEYQHLSSLYEQKADKTPDTWEFIDFEIIKIVNVEIDNLNKPSEMKVRRHKTQWDSDGIIEEKLKDIVSYTQLEKCLTPEFLRHKRPCFLTSKQTFDIVRLYVKENIDGRNAKVTSDYNSCFTVKKVINTKPWKNEILKPNLKSYRPPRFKNIETKLIDIFEMTHDKENYKKYTVIKGFKGCDLEDLTGNIKEYLDELMNYINMPVSECAECEGCGHIFNKDFKINKRKIEGKSND